MTGGTIIVEVSGGTMVDPDGNIGFTGGSIWGVVGILGDGTDGAGVGIRFLPLLGSVGTLSGVVDGPDVDGGASGNFVAPNPSFVTTDGLAGVFGAAVAAAVGGFGAAGGVG